MLLKNVLCHDCLKQLWLELGSGAGENEQIVDPGDRHEELSHAGGQRHLGH